MKSTTTIRTAMLQHTLQGASGMSSTGALAWVCLPELTIGFADGVLRNADACGNDPKGVAPTS